MNDYTLKIIFMADGTYGIFMDDGITPMEFVDKTEAMGLKNIKDAIKICVEHEYKFEIV